MKRFYFIFLFIALNFIFIEAVANQVQSDQQKEALQKVYTIEQSNVMCTSGAGKVQNCAFFSKELGDAVSEADKAGVPRSETIKTQLNAVSDGLKTTKPQPVTPGVAE